MDGKAAAGGLLRIWGEDWGLDVEEREGEDLQLAYPIPLPESSLVFFFKQFIILSHSLEVEIMLEINLSIYYFS